MEPQTQGKAGSSIEVEEVVCRSSGLVHAQLVGSGQTVAVAKRHDIRCWAIGLHLDDELPKFDRLRVHGTMPAMQKPLGCSPT